MSRSRAVPSGTVGGRMATTRKPSSSSSCEAASAACGFADHHRHDRALRLGQAGGAGEGLRLGERQRRQVRLALDQVERGDGGGDDRRRQAGGIDQRAGAVADQVDHRLRGAEIAAIAADRLGQRADLQRRRRTRSRAAPKRRGRGRRRPSARRRALARSAASSASGARSPSIENTPSVTISAR